MCLFIFSDSTLAQDNVLRCTRVKENIAEAVDDMKRVLTFGDVARDVIDRVTGDVVVDKEEAKEAPSTQGRRAQVAGRGRKGAAKKRRQ